MYLNCHLRLCLCRQRVSLRFLDFRRRWGLVLVEAAIALVLFISAILIAKPVFLKPLEAEPEPPLATAAVLASLKKNNIIGYAPDNDPTITAIMERASELLKINNVWSAPTENDLNVKLYNKSKGVPLKCPIIWVVWKPRKDNTWALSIRSTERALYVSSTGKREISNPHLKAGFLSVQLAISKAIIEHVSENPPNYEVILVSMPVSPLMKEQSVVQALSGILLCFTLALMPPVLETEALVVTETSIMLKRALRLRNVQYPSMYMGWLVYAYLTCLPICLLAALTLILIFRWIHLVEALIVVLAYTSVMIMVALMMGMFHNKAWIACIWTVLFTLLQTFIAELLVHHRYDRMHSALTFFLHLVFPPMGLVHAFNKFALLQTDNEEAQSNTSSLIFMVASWSLMNVLYFAVLMMLQRTIGQKRAIGGQVSWKSVIFKKIEDPNKLHHIVPPTRSEIGKVQEVDELVAKAISFRDVCKSIMEVPVLSNITFDIYRGEFNIMYAERTQKTSMETIEDLLTGLTSADSGTITVLGEELKPGTTVMTTPQMMGYCHQSETLIEDLTVEEHFTFYSRICLWNQTKINISEYTLIRSKRLLEECNLKSVQNERVRNLSLYYKAQLCWAIAMLLEPRVIVIPNYTDRRQYTNVIKDKIMQFKKYKTIVSFYFLSMDLEYADRVFLFDNKILVFGGTPAYLFFKFGREYRVRVTLNNIEMSEAQQKQLLDRVERAGATVRAHLGSLLILCLPTNPSATVVEFVKDLTDNSNKYGISSFAISVPDSGEVCRRAIVASRVTGYYDHTYDTSSKATLQNFTGTVKWKRRTSFWNMHLRLMLMKFFTFHMSKLMLFGVTFTAAALSGLFLGLALISALDQINPATNVSSRETLTVEDLKITTTLVLRADDSSTSRSIANGYVLSDTNAIKKNIENMEYTALPYTESLSEYLATRAIDSPQVYVYRFAYGMDVFTNINGKITVQALYSPIHHDHSAAARSLARVYMALMRHYTGSVDATIQIDDDPLVLDLSPWMKKVADPPLLIQFLLIVTISHITLLPSLEHGLIRHVQKHALNFSPFRYWFTLYFCDLLLYWLLVAVISLAMFLIMFFKLTQAQLLSTDMLVLPFMLIVYGIGCIPQAYIFSLGPQWALNTMTFVIATLVFGETTIIAKIFYGDTLSHIVHFMILSPQFNMAYAYMKIEQIFLYNNECVIFQQQNLCSLNTFHKCCEKCGVLQECFSKKSYYTYDSGILVEMIVQFGIATLFTVVLLFIEYRIFVRLWNAATTAVANRDKPSLTILSPGCQKVTKDVHDKRAKIYRKVKNRDRIDPFGECLLVTGLTKRSENQYYIHNVYFGIGRGELLAVSGLRRHGRSMLCEILAGYRMPCAGNVWSMSKYKLRSQPHKYSQQVSFCCNKDMLPPWMRVREALTLIAALRGVPRKHINKEVTNHIEALDLQLEANRFIKEIPHNDITRLHFAAAVIGAPPVIVLDDCTAFQRFAIRRSMYFILNALRKRGHAICICSGSVESHMPLTNYLAIMVNGTIYDMDSVDNLVERYNEKGCTVVVHLKDKVDIHRLFAKYFKCFIINDTTEVLVNVQIHDTELTWAQVFEKMETLKTENQEVCSYIVTVIPIDYIYNSIITKGPGIHPAKGLFSWKWLRKILSIKPVIMPKPEDEEKLVPLERKYYMTKLKELPWSAIFQR